MDEERGRGGGIDCGYVVAATLGAWALTPLGHGLQRLEATLVDAADGLLSLPGCVVWLRYGALRWEWTAPDAVPNDGDRVDMVVTGPPRIRALEVTDGTVSAGEAE